MWKRRESATWVNKLLEPPQSAFSSTIDVVDAVVDEMVVVGVVVDQLWLRRQNERVR